MNSTNRISNILYYLGILIIIISIIAGIIVGNGFILIFGPGGFILGMLILGLSEVIFLLHKINNSLNSINNPKVDSSTSSYNNDDITPNP